MASAIMVRRFFTLIFDSWVNVVGALYVPALVLGLAAIWWFKPLLAENDLAFGKHTVSMFVPFVCVGTVLAALVVFDTFSRLHAFLLMLLYLVLSLGFADIFYMPIWHYYFDDPGRYSGYAHFMLAQRTLWGGDAIAGMGQNVAYYVDQPGFRYFLAGMIQVLGGEHRLMQLSCMFLYLASLLMFLLVLRNVVSRRMFFLIAVFFVCSLPYAASNVLEGLSEWLAVTLILCFCSCLCRQNLYGSVIFLSMAPLIRQNLLITSLVLAAITIVYMAKGKARIYLAIVFIGFLCIPIYHNIYYADELIFLTTNRGYIVNWNQDLVQILFAIVDAVRWKIPHYLGYYPTASLYRTIVALLFAPLGSALLIYFLFKLPPRTRIGYLIIVAVTVGPTILFGWGYFPRFVYSNQAIVLAIIPLLVTLTSMNDRPELVR